MAELSKNENILVTQSSTKKNIQILTIAIVFIFTLKFFQSTPFERVFFQLQAIFLGLIVLFLVDYVATILKKGRINKAVLYYLILIAVIPFYSAYRANAEFGQPFICGFLSERAWLLIAVGVWFYYVLITRKINLATVKSVFVFMAWASLIIFSLFALTYDPGQLDFESNFVCMTANRGLRFRFQPYFITFGAVYYFVKHAVYKNPKDLIILLLFLAYILFIHQSRTSMMALAATFLLYYWFNYSLSKLTITAIKLSLFLLIMLMAIQIVMPDYLDRMGYLFAQMFRVLTGKMSQDASANTRIFQSQIVLSYFDAHPLSLWFGAGKVSNQWNDGYDSIFGYFYPSDIGVLGGLFLYGVVGLVFVFIIPMTISIKTLRRVSEKRDAFIIALKYLLVFAIVRAIQGSFYFGAPAYIIPFFILLAYKHLRERARAN